MKRRQNALAAVLLTSVCLLSVGMVISHDAAKQIPELRLAKPGEPIASIPQEEALKIYERHVKELQSLPGVASVSFTAGGLVVEVRDPSVLPAAVEGLPVIPVPPVDPWATRTIDGSTPVPPRPEAEPYPLPDLPELVHPDSQPCPPGSFRAPGEGRCHYVNPPSLPPDYTPPESKLLPPPSGFIVLKPSKVREQAEACPEGFKEVEGYGGWRFCVDPNNPEQIPPLWSPPIAGIPYEEVLEIYDRHLEDFAKLPGIERAGVRADGIHIYTSQPEGVPKEVEGVPIIVHPATGRKIKLLSHTFNTPIRPLHGAVFISQARLGC